MTRQVLVVLISRDGLDPNLIPPLRKIIRFQTECVAPLRLFTSTRSQIKGPHYYSNLVDHLETTGGQIDLAGTMSDILIAMSNNQQHKWRLWILGADQFSWEVVLQYKRQGIIIDTATSHTRFCQISYATGGISRTINENSMLRTFMAHFSVPTAVRAQFKPDCTKLIEFTLDCCCCQPSKELKAQLKLCSFCLAPHCLARYQSCCKCGAPFQA